MAAGKCFSLAVPVLASLYRGLNEISRSTVAGSPKACFPVHYIYGWLAFYFRTHYPVPSKADGPLMTGYSGEGGARYYDERVARRFIHNGENISWHANLFSKSGDFWIEDDSNLKAQGLSFFINIRSCYLTLRRGDSFIVEPYSPPHFCRQFGFCQDIPYVLKNDIRSFPLEEGFTLWRLSMRSKTGSRLYIPAIPIKLRSYSTERYYRWWKARHGDYLKRKIETLIAGSHPSRRKVDDAHERPAQERPAQEKPIRIILTKRPAQPGICDVISYNI